MRRHTLQRPEGDGRAANREIRVGSATLDNAAATQVRLIVCCEACRHQVGARSRRTSAANNTHRGLLSAQAAFLRSMAFHRDWLRVLAQGSGPQATGLYAMNERS
jgi:hypothetical protein